jgi:hypothetical protein
LWGLAALTCQSGVVHLTGGTAATLIATYGRCACGRF